MHTLQHLGIICQMFTQAQAAYSRFFGQKVYARSCCTVLIHWKKKKIKFSSYIRKIKMEQLQCHIWLTASSYMGKYLRIFSYSIYRYQDALPHIWLSNCSTPYIWGKFDFLFIQCRCAWIFEDTLMKMKWWKVSSYIRKFKREGLLSHICAKISYFYPLGCANI
jgi:hypothetical protein